MCICDLESSTSSTNASTENDTCLFQKDPNLENVCCLLQQYLEVEGRLVVCFVGLFFNVLVFILLLDKKLKNEIFNRLLLYLVVMDSLYLLIAVVDTWIYWVGREQQPSFDHLYLFYFIIKPLKGIVRLSIIYLTIILALQRYRTIAKPLHMIIRNQNTNKTTWTQTLKFTVPVIMISIVYMIPEFFEFSILRHELEDGKKSAYFNSTVLSEKLASDGLNYILTQIIVSDLRWSETYVLVYMNIGNILITGIIPLFMLAYFNFYIYRGMKTFLKRRWSIRRRNVEHEQDAQHNDEIRNQLNQTIILFAIVLIFIVTNILRISLNISDLILHDTTKRLYANNCTYGLPYWHMIAIPISQILMDLNSSVNFFVYCAFNQSFRSVIHQHAYRISKFCRPLNCFKQRPRDQILHHSEMELETLNGCSINQPEHVITDSTYDN